jgi:hypothetical protein
VLPLPGVTDEWANFASIQGDRRFAHSQGLLQAVKIQLKIAKYQDISKSLAVIGGGPYVLPGRQIIWSIR